MHNLLLVVKYCITILNIKVGVFTIKLTGKFHYWNQNINLYLIILFSQNLQCENMINISLLIKHCL